MMIARAGEANPTCFSDEPLVDLDKTLLPSYLRLVCVLHSRLAVVNILPLISQDTSTIIGASQSSALLSSKVAAST